MVVYSPNHKYRKRIFSRIKKIGDKNAIKAARNTIGLIYGQNTSIRKKAIEKLGRCGEKYAINPLREALKIVGNFDLKPSIVDAIGNIGNKRAIDILVNTLKNVNVGYLAARELGEIGRPALKPTLEALNGAGSSRLNATKALGLIGVYSPKVVNSLINLLDASNWEVRLEAAGALGKIGKPVLGKLLNIIDKGSASDRKIEATAIAIGHIGKFAIPPLVKRLRFEDSHTRHAASFALSEIGLPAVKPLIRELGKSEPRSKRRRATIIALIQMGEVATSPLIDALKNPTHKIRKGASIVLGKIGDPAVKPLIKKGLNSDNYTVRKYAASALVRLGLPAMEEVLKSIGYEISDDITYKIVRNKLINALAVNKKESIKNKAIAVLGKLGKPTAEPLIKASRNPILREGAIKALVAIGKPVFIPVIEKCFNSEKEESQKIGREIITQIIQNSFKKRALSPEVKMRKIKNMSFKELKNLISTTEYPGTRAVALYYLQNSNRSKNYLKDYLFDTKKIKENNKIVELCLKKQNISKLEMASILSTGIPLESNWWRDLANKEEKIDYLSLVLKGDFTDKRVYVQEVEESIIGKGRVWLCVQFATQLTMNFNGYGKENYADKKVFKKFGPGYSIPSVKGYGIPLYYAGTPAGHAFNAVFVGERNPNSDLKDWIFIEPMEDDFSPSVLGEQVNIYLDPFFTPDGYSAGHYPDCKKIIVETAGYHYGANNW